MSRPLVRITVPEGEDEHAVWARHVIASLGEGCCPYCAGRLEPCPTERGPGGRCPADGRWWVGQRDGAPAYEWWREYNPHTGEPLIDDHGRSLR